MAKKSAPRSFAQRLKAFAKDIPKQQNEIKKELARECVFQVVGDTPVDTGRARGGWRTGIGSPNNNPAPSGPYGPSKYSSKSGYSTAGSKTRGGNESLNDAYAKIKTAKPKQKIYLTNNVEYIVYLNDSERYRNFFKIAIDRAKGIITRQKIRYGVK